LLAPVVASADMLVGTGNHRREQGG